MTLIMGLNLTDRIILAGDTKVSRNGETVGYCIKVIQFGDKERKNFVSCAFAGNKHFVKYLALEINKAIESGVLTTDINWLIKNIDSFFKKIVPLYEGEEKHKKALIIFGGVSTNPDLLKAFDNDAFTDIFGKEGGRVEDENLMFALQTNFKALPTREQKIFSYEISSPKGIFELSKIGGVYSFIYGGSTEIEPEIQKQVQRIFLDKRKIEEETKDVLNLLRSKYSDTIGGAINVGFIDSTGRLKFIGYELDRSGKEHPTNWSVQYKETITGISPTGEEVDLIAGFYDDMSDKSGLEL
ncbi:MAG TPA: hypothetical protein VGO63_02080 [Candidatus Paceibacterota bacterium]|jgi:hypothetical protein|nr:hypothetical protein [Candidatus Paceibacterota bacterium]